MSTEMLVVNTAEQDELLARPVAALPEILLRTSQDITAVLDTLYRSRALLERSMMPRLHHTHEKLVNISSATETAAHELLDGLSRSLVLIDALAREHAHQKGGATAAALEMEEKLREEVYALIACVQFQDIVAQQIAHATRVLRDTERRISTVAEHVSTAVFGAASTGSDSESFEEPGVPTTVTHDPDLQALADSIFSVDRTA